MSEQNENWIEEAGTTYWVDPFITVEEAAQLLGCPRHLIHAWMAVK